MSYIGSTPTTQSFIAGTDSFNGTGSATNFTLSRLVNSTNDIQVVVNNVVQYPPNYSVSGNTLTISPAPSAGTNNVYVRYLSTTLQSIAPSQGSSIQFGTGSLALPSISFIGDPNTGIYSPAADTIAFVEGGVEAMRIDSSANVVIGTSSASARLQVHLNSADFVTAKISNSVTGTGVLDGFDLVVGTSGEAYIYNRENQPIIFGTNNTERARIDSSGNLLVNTTNSNSNTFKFKVQSTTDVCLGFASATAVSGALTLNAINDANSANIPLDFRGSAIHASNGIGTTASPANASFSAGENNRFYRSTSALKYKQDIRDLESIDINKFRPVRYKSKCENDDQTKDYFGIVADEVHDAGIPELVTYGVDTEIEGFQYERLTVVLLKTLQEQQAMIDTMKQEIAELKAKVGE